MHTPSVFRVVFRHARILHPTPDLTFPAHKTLVGTMGVAKNTRKFAQTKRIIGKRDARLKENKDKADIVQEAKKKATANGELSMS